MEVSESRLSQSREQRLKIKFKQETGYHIEVVRDCLQKLGQAAGSPEVLQTLFIACHTVRGNLGMMSVLWEGLAEPGEAARQLEEVALALKNGETLYITEYQTYFYDRLHSIELYL